MAAKTVKGIKKLTDGSTIPFRGGVDTAHEKALVEFGKFSTLNNMRNRHPGLEQRLGMTYHHSTAYSTTLFIRTDQGTGSFSTGDSLVFATSGATATAASVLDIGNDETLIALSSVSGTPQDNEVIYVASYGDELLTNGNFTNWTGDDPDDWTISPVEAAGYYITESSGKARFVSDGTYISIYQDSIATADCFYIYSVDVTDLTSGSVKIDMEGLAIQLNSVATHTGIIQSSGTKFRIARYDGTTDATVDNASLKKITNAALVNGTAINSPHSLYQFSKGKRVERHFFAQMRDGVLLKATDNPPTTTTGAFGSSVHSGSVSDICASYSDLDDIMIFSNGVDQHQLYAGTANPVLAFMKFDHASAAPTLWPESYVEYTRQVTDGDSSTVAVLDSLNTIAAFECVYIATPIPANRITWTISAVNATASVGTLKYRKSDNTWADTSETDGTILSGATLGQSGSMTWTHPSDEIPITLFGISAYWYQWEVATQLDAEVEVSAVTYGSGFTSLTNVWNGRKDYIIEAVFDDDAESIQYNYSGDNVTIDAMTTSDVLYVSSHDPLQGIYIDVGGSPNTETTTTIADVQYWTGTAWASYTETDFTAGLNQSGWIMWGRLSFGTEQKRRIAGSPVEAYWYKITIGVATTSTLNVSIEGMPYYDILDFGKGGTSTTWKDRGVYSFNKYPNYLYVSEMYRPNVLNGNDFAILEAGDGRSNEVKCMKKFHNELMVWQEELGRDGGCLTIFEGYSPETFGKLVLSTKVGTFSPKSAVVVDGVLTSAETEDKFRTEAYFISHYGICMTDGLTVQVVSDDIQNYFDPQESECIRRGYEFEMWVEHDSADNVLRFGLVSGTSATTCNVFPVYDLVDKTWSFDTFGQNLSCITEVEAESGDTPMLQYGGGTDDGAVYRLNTGTNDVDIGTTTTAISSSATLEISIKGFILQLRELLLRMKSQSAGNCIVTFYRRGVADSNTLSLPMTAEITNDASRRHRIGVKSLKGDQLGINFANSTASQSLYLLDFGLGIDKIGDR